MISRSTNCGQTWSTPIALSTGSRLVQNPQIAVSPTDGAVYVSWRRFAYTSQDDAVMIVKSVNGGTTFSKPLRVSGIRSFDLPTLATQFRSNGFQTMAIDATGRVYLAWPDRGYAAVRNDPVTGDSRIVMSTSTTGSTWSVPRAIQPAGVGHQLMPAMAFHGGKLRILYYDLREDVSQLFGPQIDEAPILTGPTPRIRHTMDVFVAQAGPGASPAFTTARVSEYASGFLPGSTVEQRLQFNPPNLPLFRQGAVPFMGDYIDLAPAPPFILNDNGTWSFNTGATGSTVSHAIWTDNRDVRPPVDGNWANYTPVTSPAVGTQSRFDPTQQVPNCEPGQVGMRNQNIYTARVTDGLFVSAPGNNKQFNGFQRAFVVVAENASPLPRVYRLRIENQPVGGQASFLQFGAPLTTLDVTTPAFSSVARSVFVTAQDQNARTRVSVTQINAPGGTVVANGLTGTVVLNPDPQNPVLQNPVLQNPNCRTRCSRTSRRGSPTTRASARRSSACRTCRIRCCRTRTCRIRTCRTRRFRTRTCRIRTCRIPSLQNPVLQNDAVANPSIVNADLPNPNLQNPNVAESEPAEPQPAEPEPAERGDQRHQLGGDERGEHDRVVHGQPAAEQPGAGGFLDAAADPQDVHDAGRRRVRTQGAAAHDPAGEHSQSAVRHRSGQSEPAEPAPPESEPAESDAGAGAWRIGDGHPARHRSEHLRRRGLRRVGRGDAGRRRAVREHRRRRRRHHHAVGCAAAHDHDAEIPPTTPGAPINRTHADWSPPPARSRASSFPVWVSLPPGVTLSSTGTLSGTPTTPGNYEFTVECVDSGPPERRDRQTLTIQVNPASPVGYDALWNGLDSNWYNPANWSPRGVPAETSRVYFSAATSVVPTLTANVTVRDLFLEPGATLDTNGFTLTVTNNADAGHTIIGLRPDRADGQRQHRRRRVLQPRDCGTHHAVGAVDHHRHADARPGRAARVERPAADRRRTADHQRHRRARCRSSSAPPGIRSSSPASTSTAWC